MTQIFENTLSARLEAAYQTLRSAGLVHTQGDFATLIGINRSSLSRASSGDPRYLTDSLIRKAEAAAESAGAIPVPTPSALPVLPLGARAGSIQDWCDAVHDYDCEKIVSPIRGASLAAQVAGDSMAPEFPSGSQVIVKKIDQDAFVQWGEAYLLDTVNGPVLKIVRKSEVEGEVECVSINPAFQTFRVKCSDIRGWYRVLLCMALK